MLGALKIRAVPINVNYRYVEDELSYLIGNAELVACVYDQEYAGRLAAVADRSPKLTTFVHIEDGSPKSAAIGREKNVTAKKNCSCVRWKTGSVIVPSASATR